MEFFKNSKFYSSVMFTKPRSKFEIHNYRNIKKEKHNLNSFKTLLSP